VHVQVTVIERAEEKVHDQLRIASGWNVATRDGALDDGPSSVSHPVHKTLAPGNRETRVTLYLRDEMSHSPAPAASVRQPDPVLGGTR